MDKKQAAYKRGIWAERVAALYLQLKGYRILARRYKTPVGEIDLIARRGNVVAFIEVKARPTIEEALNAIPPRAQKRITRAAEYYLMKHPENAERTLRFDVIAFSGWAQVGHLENAW